jgi:hypothetical protein
MSEIKKKLIDEQIAKARARLAELQAQKSKEGRQERNGELMAIGITVENQFANAPDEVKAWLTEAANVQTEVRTRQRAVAALNRFAKKD